jgi:hypothetical protein
MSNSRLESIAAARRAAELHRISVQRERAARRRADAIGHSGTPRPASMTAEIQKVIDELDAKAARLTALRGDELVAEFALG